MAQHNSLNVRFFYSQLNKLKSAIKIQTSIALGLSYSI